MDLARAHRPAPDVDLALGTSAQVDPAVAGVGHLDIERGAVGGAGLRPVRRDHDRPVEGKDELLRGGSGRVRAVLRRLGKLALTVVICLVVFRWVDPLAPGWFFVGMIGVIMAGWVGLYRAMSE